MDRRHFSMMSIGVAFSASGFDTRLHADEVGSNESIVQYPKILNRSCRNGSANIYDECGSQQTIFDDALKYANLSRRTLLVIYGAEWCIWCHVFDAYISGKAGHFEYTFEGRTANFTEYNTSLIINDANALHNYVKEGFVVAHIEGNYSSDGKDVLKRTGADRHFEGSLPFIFTVTSGEKFAAAFDGDLAEVRREGVDWFRGYDRKVLLSELQEMRKAAAPS